MKSTLAICGDVLVSRRYPKELPDKLQIISDILKENECVFGNLETTIRKNEGYPEEFPGGTYCMAEPLALQDLKRIGFNVFNTANNHAMDYSHGGLLATLKYLDDEGIPHCGTGINMAAAAAPTYFECKESRFAFLGVCSSFNPAYKAGPQNMEMQGRPGISPLRHKAVYELTENNYSCLKKIAKETGINAYHDQARKEGFLPKTDLLKFGTYDFVCGNKNQVSTKPLQEDLDRTISNIKEAKLQSDIVCVSIHSHQFAGIDKHNVPQFIQIFAHECIDAGADIIICHGPHVMRGIEVYNNRFIFHGLGNFIFQIDTRGMVGEQEYLNAGTTRQNETGFGGLNYRKTKGGTIGLGVDKDAWYSYFATIKISDNEMKAKIYPIEINQGCNGGVPSICNNKTILKQLQNMSEKWNTKICVNEEKNIATVKITL